MTHAYGESLAASASSVPSPAQMPGAKCGRLTGLYRCVRKADHGGNCTMQRRDDVDQAEDDGQLAPPVTDEQLALQDVVNGAAVKLRDFAAIPADVLPIPRPPAEQPMPARWATPYGVADQLDIAAKALRWSGAKALTGSEQRHAQAIARSIVGRVDRELSAHPPEIRGGDSPT